MKSLFMDGFKKNRPPVCSSHREEVAHFKKSEVKVIDQGHGQFKNRRTLLNLHFFSNAKNSATSVFVSSRSSSTFKKKSEVKVIGQGQGHFKNRRTL